MGPGPPGGDVQRAKRQRTITNSRPEQHLGITWDNKLRPPRRSEPGATRMKADLWLPVRIAMRPWLGVDPGHADGAPRPTATAVVELAGAMARTARHRSESELQRAELAEAQVPAEAACRVIVILRDLQGVCSSVADFSGDSRFCPTTTTRSSTRVRGSLRPLRYFGAPRSACAAVKGLRFGRGPKTVDEYGFIVSAEASVPGGGYTSQHDRINARWRRRPDDYDDDYC